MAVIRALAVVIVLCVLAGLGLIVVAWRSPVDPVDPPKASSFDGSLVSRGASLASIGNCNTCHTLPGGQPFAGGLGLPTPFGTIYSTNITPDPDTGIGRWSEEAFRRAMREGVDREGRHLYPVFPYDHFTLVKDEDIRALYAYFMTRGSVRATAPANDIPFPLNLRPLIAGWKLLFLRPGPYAPDAAQSDVWNRGAYLVEGLAHCGACHTPRNILGAEKTQDRFAGGEAEGWTAYALNQASPAPVPWDSEALRIYLRNGWHEAHGVARGPMAPVIDNLASIPDSDLRAMTTYMVAIIGEPSAQRRLAGKALIEHARKPGPRSEPASTETQTIAGSDHSRTPGALIYQAACASCHESGRPLPFGGIDLSLSTGPSGPDARNVINVVLWGLPPAEGERSPIMPGFAGSFSDQQLAALLSYMRSRFSDKPAWTDIEKDIRDARTGRRPVMVYPAPGTDPAQAALSQREVQ